MFSPRERSFSRSFCAALLFNTRSVLRKGLITSLVSSSVALSKASFTLGWQGASWVAMKRVPILIASAPNARAATSDRPSAIPPEATIGISNSSAALGRSIKLGTSSSPGWPPHSKPSTETASHPIDCAFSECLTEVHLWITITPASFNAGMTCCGLRPAVSTTLTPSSMITFT